MDAKAALKYAKDQEAKFVSVRFTDLVGAWHHLTYPIHELDESITTTRLSIATSCSRSSTSA